MTDRPIIFSAPMVLALLREAAEPGTGKSMTRRLAWRMDCGNRVQWIPSLWQKVQPGDRLYVRENFSYRHAWTVDQIGGPIWCWADGNPDRGDWTKPKPSIHMPRWASRLTLIVTATRIERLRDISEQDCEREGLVWVPTQKIWGGAVEGGYSPYGLTAQECFMHLFCDLHGPAIWRDNPEVCCISFNVTAQNIDLIGKAAA